jgi:hypothetical protein
MQSVTAFRRFKNRPHRGQGILESVFGMVMFVSMIALTCTICMMLFLQNALVGAARQGARVASINPDYGAGNTSTANTAVKSVVKTFMAQTAGQTLTDNQVTITAPTGTIGQRNVTVRINYSLTNPVPIAGFLSGLGATGTSSLATIPLVAQASMRYED